MLLADLESVGLDGGIEVAEVVLLSPLAKSWAKPCFICLIHGQRLSSLNRFWGDAMNTTGRSIAGQLDTR